MRHFHPTVLLLVITALVLAGCGLDRSDAGQVSAGEQVAGRLTDELQDWGCGHAFTVGTPDQEARLSLWFDGSPTGTVPEPGTQQLGEEWTGQLVAGSDLFAQWCDDVITPDEPEVVEHATWEIDGTLTWELQTGDGQCPSVATATLTDAAVMFDGEAVPVADVEFHNEHFGCVAG